MTDPAFTAAKALTQAREHLEAADDALKTAMALLPVGTDRYWSMSVPGLVHEVPEGATPEEAGWEERFGHVYSGNHIILEVDIDIPKVYPAGSQLIWLAVERHRDLLALLLWRDLRQQPGRFILRAGIDQQHGDKQKVMKPGDITPGKYHLRVDSDSLSTVCLLSRGNTIEQRLAAIDLGPLPAGRLAVGFGFRGEYDHEPAQVGWRWSNLRIRVEE